MKKAYLIGILIFTLMISGKPVTSQTHNIRMDLSSLALADLRFSYEHILDDNISVMIKFGGMIPRSVPGIIYNPTAVEQEYGGGVDLKNRLGAFSIAGEFRFYTGKNPSAPDGFYVAPYLRYNSYSFKTSVVYTDNISEAEYEDLDPEEQEHAVMQPNGSYEFTGHGLFDGSLKRFGGGLAIGYQWLIGENFTIDWTFLGLGVERWNFGIEAINETENYDPDFEEWSDEIDSEAEDFFFIGDKIEIETEPDRIKMNLPLTMPSFYSSFTIGYAF
ncbi:MAG: DUF3575 domain-containing protein [Bacteroidales bacterium]